MRFRSIVTQFVLITCGLFILFTAPSRAAQNEEVTLRLWHPHTGERQHVLDALVGQFNAENDEDIAIEAVSFEDPGLLYDQIILQLTTINDLPNLIMVWPHEAALFDLADVIVDLSNFDIPTEIDGRRGYNPITQRQLGLPDRSFVEIMAVNMEALRESGYQIPPTTLAELETMACSFQRWTGGRFGNVWGFVLPMDAEFLMAISGSIFDPTSPTQPLIDTLPRRQTLTTLTTMHQDGCISSAPNSFDAIDIFAQGRALFYFGSSSSLPILHERIRANFATPFEWAVYPLPNSTRPLTFGPVISIIDHQPATNAAAWSFLQWFLSPDINQSWAEATMSLPIHAGISIETFPQRQQAWELAQMETATIPALAGYDVIRLEILFSWQRLLTGVSPVEQELEALQTLTNQIILDFAGEPTDDEQG